ncbi:MAG: putative metalloprotease CJM1_0395 family protein [Planctomycetota bacterium]
MLPASSISAARFGAAPALRGQGAQAAAVRGTAEPARPPAPRGDGAELSTEGLAALAALGEAQGAEAEGDAAGTPRGTDGEPLTREEETEVRELQARDKEVRAHEEAHKAAAGDLALGGPTYEFEQGPDGRDYAVGGEVQIALKEGETPEETADNARRARRAALAPAEPSSQDLKVAAEAAQMEAEANRAAAEERRTGSTGRADGEGRPGGDDEDIAPGDAALLERAAAYRAIADSVRPNSSLGERLG